MIRSWKDKHTELVFRGECPKGFPVQILKVARRKLEMLNAAISLESLRVPPNNQLHPLTGDRAGQHAIRINRQFRVCFVWTNEGPADVEIVDYH